MKPNTPEWYAARKGGIGASDAPIIMGHSPWKTIHALYKEKKTPYVEGAETSNFAMNHGRAMEPQAIESFVQSTGFKVVYDTDDMFKWKSDLLYEKKPFMFATYDGLLISEKTFVEIKCPYKSHSFDLAKNQEIPEQYYTQMQHQMFVHPDNPEYAYYYCYFEGEGVLLKIDRDEEAIAKIIAAELKFMDCLHNNVPPERKKSVRKSYPILDA